MEEVVANIVVDLTANGLEAKAKDVMDGHRVRLAWDQLGG